MGKDPRDVWQGLLPLANAPSLTWLFGPLAPMIAQLSKMKWLTIAEK
jgi:hypothetical protein